MLNFIKIFFFLTPYNFVWNYVKLAIWQAMYALVTQSVFTCQHMDSFLISSSTVQNFQLMAGRYSVLYAFFWSLSYFIGISYSGRTILPIFHYFLSFVLCINWSMCCQQLCFFTQISFGLYYFSKISFLLVHNLKNPLIKRGKFYFSLFLMTLRNFLRKDHVTAMATTVFSSDLTISSLRGQMVRKYLD